MVESSCKSGQLAATKDLVEHIKRYVAENTEKGTVSVYTSPSKVGGRKAKVSTRPPAEKTTGEARSSAQLSNEGRLAEKAAGQPFGGSAYVLPLLLTITLLLALNLFYQMSIKRDMDSIQDFISLQTSGNWGRANHPLIDLPAKAPSAKGGLAGELKKWLGRTKPQNTTYATSSASGKR